MPDRESHKARKWVEEYFPDAEGQRKGELILAYGFGLDHGLKEAQSLIMAALQAVETGTIGRD